MSNSKPFLCLAASKTEGEIFIKQVLNISRFQWEERKNYDLFRLQDGLNVFVAVTGMGPVASYQALKDIFEEFKGIASVVGFGLCGGLVKTLRRGDLVIPSEILFQGQALVATSEWLRMRFLRELDAIPAKTSYTSAKLIDLPAAKAAIYAATGAEAVDMESHSWVKACHEENIACVIVRSVLDEAQESLSPELALMVDERGNVKVWQVIKSLLNNPALLKDLIAYNPRNLAKVMAAQTTLIRAWLTSERQIKAEQRQSPNVVGKVG